MKKIYILFQGFGQKINEWNIKPTYFLSKLEKKGKVFIYRNRLIEQDNEYPLSYLTINGFIDDIYYNLIKQIPDAKNFIWIPIGESFGGCLALIFSLFFIKKCNCCVLLDNPPYFTLKNNKHRIKMTEKMMGNKFRILTENKFNIIIKTNPDYLIDYFVILIATYIKNNIIGKEFPIKVFGFYNIEYPDKYEKKFETNNNDALFDEINKLKKIKNFCYNLFINAGHMIYLDQDVVKCILNTI
jgi:hypothetical protein